MSMFCYQCEQTAKGTGCSIQGVCGKSPQTAALQDVLVHATKGLGVYAYRLKLMGLKDPKVDALIDDALFMTLTNVNFDPKDIENKIRAVAQQTDLYKKDYETKCRQNGTTPEKLSGPASYVPGSTMQELVEQGMFVGVLERKKKYGDDITGLQDLILFGLKGLAAYAHHARLLGKSNNEVSLFVCEALDTLAREETDLNTLLGLSLKCGQVNLKVMEMLDAGHTETFGNPAPTQVRTTPIKGKAILISGHDLVDLEALLKQTEGTGINIYTHGEMLTAHSYPNLKKYKHLVGNYGTAWQNQTQEFDKFPGAILMTTNCLQRPKDTYKTRIFTSGVVGWPDVAHVRDQNFKPVIDSALSSPGFINDEPEKQITIGFGHHAVLSVADKVIEGIKGGKIKHFFLIGGCDGAKPGRNYYTEFAEKTPKDTVILTLACGKYRINHLELGDIDGIPRLLDMGQCNDAHSAIQVAVALAKAFNTDVNSLPLSMILSWYEQKAVVILLSLLSLGIKNIRLGPSLPAFVTPAALKILHDKFNIMPITTVDQDLKACLRH